MRLKVMTLVAFAALFICVGVARAEKTYRLKIGDTAKIGSVELQPGEYKIALTEGVAKFTQLRTGEQFQVPAKTSDSEQKHNSTEIHTEIADGRAQIVEIRLGGSRTRIDFR